MLTNSVAFFTTAILNTPNLKPVSYTVLFVSFKENNFKHITFFCIFSIISNFLYHNY